MVAVARSVTWTHVEVVMRLGKAVATGYAEEEPLSYEAPEPESEPAARDTEAAEAISVEARTEVPATR